MEWRKGEFTLTDDRTALDMAFIVRSLQTTYWAGDRTTEQIETSFANSLCFALFKGGRPVGCARVVTDKAVFSWIADVFIAEDHRRQGAGTWMIECILSHPDVARTRKRLRTEDAHGFYERLGFRREEMLIRPD
jgi:GNAT superfamily N-acetyltransferase